MTDQEQKEGKISIILTPDTEGIKKVFGVPAARRLALLCTQIGFGEIHIVGGTDHFKELLSDLAAPDGFHPCLLYTSDAADDLLCVDFCGRRIIKKKKNQH